LGILPKGLSLSPGVGPKALDFGPRLDLRPQGLDLHARGPKRAGLNPRPLFSLFGLIGHSLYPLVIILA